MSHLGTPKTSASKLRAQRKRLIEEKLPEGEKLTAAQSRSISALATRKTPQQKALEEAEVQRQKAAKRSTPTLRTQQSQIQRGGRGLARLQRGQIGQRDLPATVQRIQAAARSTRSAETDRVFSRRRRWATPKCPTGSWDRVSRISEPGHPVTSPSEAQDECSIRREAPRSPRRLRAF